MISRFSQQIQFGLVVEITGVFYFLNEQITHLDEEVAGRLDPFQEDIERVDTIPGIARVTAEQILAVIGTEVGSRFPSAAHLCSWIGLLLGHNESAGKRKPSKTRKANKYLRSSLIEASQSICRSDNYLGALYRRIAACKGGRRATVAVAHAIMKFVYHLLTRNEDYRDLGADYFENDSKMSSSNKPFVS